MKWVLLWSPRNDIVPVQSSVRSMLHVVLITGQSWIDGLNLRWNCKKHTGSSGWNIAAHLRPFSQGWKAERSHGQNCGDGLQRVWLLGRSSQFWSRKWMRPPPRRSFLAGSNAEKPKMHFGTDLRKAWREWSRWSERMEKQGACISKNTRGRPWPTAAERRMVAYSSDFSGMVDWLTRFNLKALPPHYRFTWKGGRSNGERERVGAKEQEGIAKPRQGQTIR